MVNEISIKKKNHILFLKIFFTLKVYILFKKTYLALELYKL